MQSAGPQRATAATHCPRPTLPPAAPAGESGVGSGVRREWFRLLAGHFLDGRSGLLASADGGRTWQPSVDARLQGDHLPFFSILGEPTGLAKSGTVARGRLAPQGLMWCHDSCWCRQAQSMSQHVDAREALLLDVSLPFFQGQVQPQGWDCQ